MARLPNIPTVWSNVFTAWVLGTGLRYDEPWRGFWPCLVAGTFLYAGGAIFSEALDAQFDREHRPERPVPSGRIPRALAATVGLGLWLASGIFFCVAAKWNIWALIPMLVVMAYGLIHKRVPSLAVLLMGGCRASLVYAVIMTWGWSRFTDVLWGPSSTATLYMATLWIYVSTISWVALGEMNLRHRKIVGLMLAALPFLDALFLFFSPQIGWVLVPLACAGMAWALRRVAAAT